MRGIVRTVGRTVWRISRTVRRRSMYRLRVQATLPLPTGDEVVSGETMISVPGTRRTGTFRALLQRASEMIIGESDDDSGDESEHEIDPNQLAIENGTVVDQGPNLSRWGRIWNVFSSVTRVSMAAISHAPSIFGVFGGLVGLYNSYRRLNGDDEFILIRRSELNTK